MSVLTNIESSYESYQNLIYFYDANKNKKFNDIHIELKKWFGANMSATLGAVLDKFTSNFNNVYFNSLDPEIETILLSNDFLTYYGRQRSLGEKRTTIKFQKLRPTDGKYFKNYVINELIESHTTDLPEMSSGVKEKIIEGIYEIFVNAQTHSKTNFIYTCGQFFPRKHEIEFTIVDVGIGFKERVNQRFNSNLSVTQAIKWAVQDKKTTKEGVSGGIGLTVLKEFIEMNKGKMQIISNEGFYQYDYNSEVTREFIGQFPGTIVNLQFRTDDKNNYQLKNEIDVKDIF